MGILHCDVEAVKARTRDDRVEKGFSPKPGRSCFIRLLRQKNRLNKPKAPVSDALPKNNVTPT
jgi:hypothetical protein